MISSAEYLFYHPEEQPIVKCEDCGSRMVLRKSQHGYFYGCTTFPECSGTHGCHQNSGKPLGKPANAETRALRVKAHGAFDKLWIFNGRWRRNEAYAWLADRMTIPYDQCHIGSFNSQQCRQVIIVCEKAGDLPACGGELYLKKSLRKGKA